MTALTVVLEGGLPLLGQSPIDRERITRRLQAEQKGPDIGELRLALLDRLGAVAGDQQKRHERAHRPAVGDSQMVNRLLLPQMPPRGNVLAQGLTERILDGQAVSQLGIAKLHQVDREIRGLARAADIAEGQRHDRR